MVSGNVRTVDLSRGGSQQRLALQVPVVAHLTLLGLRTITMRRGVMSTMMTMRRWRTMTKVMVMAMMRAMIKTMAMMIMFPPEEPLPRKAAVFLSTAPHSEISSSSLYSLSLMKTTDKQMRVFVFVIVFVIFLLFLHQ